MRARRSAARRTCDEGTTRPGAPSTTPSAARWSSRTVEAPVLLRIRIATSWRILRTRARPARSTMRDQRLQLLVTGLHALVHARGDGAVAGLLRGVHLRDAHRGGAAF